MGTWGTAIFDDDVASDVRGAFEDELADGADVPTATKRVLADFADYLDDEDDGPIVYLALAALQLEHGSLGANIRKKAIQIIDSGEGLSRWEEADPQDLLERRRALEELRAQMNQ